jgi:hypothetical protein
MKRILTVTVAMLIAAGCSSTEPILVTSLRGPSAVQGFDTTINGTPSYGCHYLLTATVSGTGPQQYIVWGGGHYAYLRQDGDTLSGQLTNAGSLFGGASILGAGTTISQTQGNFWTLPFQFSEVLYYTHWTGAQIQDSATYSYSCQ